MRQSRIWRILTKGKFNEKKKKNNEQKVPCFGSSFSPNVSGLALYQLQSTLETPQCLHTPWKKKKALWRSRSARGLEDMEVGV